MLRQEQAPDPAGLSLSEGVEDAAWTNRRGAAARGRKQKCEEQSQLLSFLIAINNLKWLSFDPKAHFVP
jgi:hypothetical protein